MGRRTRTRTGNRVGRREGASGCRPPPMPPTPPSSATERCFMRFVEEHSLALLSLSLLSSVGGAAVATAAAAMRLQLQLRPRPLAARREKNKLTVVRLPAPAAVSDPRKLLMRCRILSIDIDCCTICSRSVERQAYFDFFCATTSSTAIPTIDDRCGWHLARYFPSFLVSRTSYLVFAT